MGAAVRTRDAYHKGAKVQDILRDEMFIWLGCAHTQSLVPRTYSKANSSLKLCAKTALIFTIIDLPFCVIITHRFLKGFLMKNTVIEFRFMLDNKVPLN